MATRTRLFRTSSFRLTLRIASVQTVLVLVLYGIVEWSATGFLERQIDDTVAGELAEIRLDAAAAHSLTDVVAGLARHSPGVAYLLQDRTGRVLAGNLGPLVVLPGLRRIASTDRTGAAEVGGIRGRGIVLASGQYLFVGISDFEIREMQEAVARAFAAGFAVVLLLAIAGGILSGASVLRRIEAISRTSRDIMAGDLGRRIALGDTDDEFDHLAASLNAMLDRIATLMEGLAQVSNDIAHDLRTPLTRLRQRLELARSKQNTVAGLHETLDASIGDADGILETFAAILRIAQVSSGSRRAGFKALDLGDLVDEIAEIYAPVAEEKAQTITRAIEPKLTIEGDRELLAQLFVNLVENAIRHCPDGTRIAMSAQRHGHDIVARVGDDGPGIEEAYRKRVVARFFRLDASRTTSGNGLGLGLVQAIATLHDAAFTLEDNAPGLRCVLRFHKPGP